MKGIDRLVDSSRGLLDSGYYREGSHDFSLQSMVKALRKKGRNQIVAELKLASYSEDRIMDESDMESTMRDLVAGGACGLSILPEPNIYKGTLEHISMAKTLGLPVLVSDFIIDPRQVVCARSWGGDAVMLLYSFFRSRHATISLDEMMETARDYGMEVVLEVGNTTDFMQAIKTDADAIGLNNLDFATGEVDISRTQNILTEAEAILSEGLRNKPILTMGGIETRAELDNLKRCGATAFLMGESLYKGVEAREKIKEFL